MSSLEIKSKCEIYATTKIVIVWTIKLYISKSISRIYKHVSRYWTDVDNWYFLTCERPYIVSWLRISSWYAFWCHLIEIFPPNYSQCKIQNVWISATDISSISKFDSFPSFLAILRLGEIVWREESIKIALASFYSNAIHIYSNSWR